MARRDHEIEVADALKDFLDQQGFLCTYTMPDPDPPDFEFLVTVGNKQERWAVEETQVHQYLTRDGNPDSRATVTEFIESMFKEIKAAAPAKLNARYLLSAFGPISRKTRQDAVRSAAGYLGGGSKLGQGWTSLVADGSVKIREITGAPGIQWMHGVGASAPGGNGRSVNFDIEENFRYTMTRILDAKQPRLARFPGHDRRLLVVSKTDQSDLFATADSIRPTLAGMSIDAAAIDAVLFATMVDDHPFDDGATRVIPAGTVEVVVAPGNWIPAL